MSGTSSPARSETWKQGMITLERGIGGSQEHGCQWIHWQTSWDFNETLNHLRSWQHMV